MNQKNNVVFIYDEKAENFEIKILKIFEKYLELNMPKRADR